MSTIKMGSTTLTLDAALVEKCKSVEDAEANEKDPDEDSRYYAPDYMKWQEKTGEICLSKEENLTELVVEVEANDAAEIKRLRLNSNRVMKVVGAEKLTALTELDCRNCNFDSIPTWIKSLPAIKTIDFSKNAIKEIPSWLEEMPTLRVFRVDDNDIQSLPSNLFQHSLNEVRLSGNKNLTSIPTPAKNLKILSLVSCNIDSLPSDLFQHSLEELG